MKKRAFTLAEVLVTLSIIGIVAAMTLPTLIQKQQDKQLISATKKVWSDINNAFLLSQQEYGVVGDNGFLFNKTDSNYTVAKNLAKHFVGAKVCKNSSETGCAQYYYDIKYATLRVDGDSAGKVDSSKTLPKIILSNGAIIKLSSNFSGCDTLTYTGTHVDSTGKPLKNPDGSNKTYTYQSSICANITFDVNGSKKPNQYGRDTYHFWVYRNKLQFSTEKYLGGASLSNIFSGKDKLEYENYNKGQVYEF